MRKSSLDLISSCFITYLPYKWKMLSSERVSFSIIIVGRVDFLLAVKSVCLYTRVCTCSCVSVSSLDKGFCFPHSIVSDSLQPRGP